MIIRELLISLGYELDEDSLKNLEKLEKGVLKAVKRLAKMLTVVVALTGALVAMVAAMEGVVDRLGKSAQRIGIAVGELDALRFAAELATGSANGLDGAIERLSRTASEAARGVGAGVEVFGFLGVSPEQNGRVKNARQLLGEIADALQQFDRARQLEFAEKLGLGELILLLDQGSEGINRMVGRAEELGLVTEEQARRAAAFNDELSRTFGRLFRNVGVFISAELAPVITEIVKSINEWIVANKEWLKTELTKAVQTLGKVLKGIFAVLQFGLLILGKIIKAVGGLDNALKILLVTFGLLLGAAFISTLTAIFLLLKKMTVLLMTGGMLKAVGLLSAKLLIIGGLIALIALVVEDIAAIFDPNKESFFDRLVEKLPIIQQLLQPIADIIVGMEEAMGAIIDLIKTGDFKAFADRAGFGLNSLLRGGLGPVLGPLFFPEEQGDVSGVGRIGVNALRAQNAAATGGIRAPRMATGGLQQTNNINQTINGGDPEEVRRATEEALNNAGRRALQDIKTSIRK